MARSKEEDEPEDSASKILEDARALRKQVEDLLHEIRRNQREPAPEDEGGDS